jgi:hypothetical protein
MLLNLHTTKQTFSRFSARAQVKLLASKHTDKVDPRLVSTHTIAIRLSCMGGEESEKPCEQLIMPHKPDMTGLV